MSEHEITLDSRDGGYDWRAVCSCGEFATGDRLPKHAAESLGEGHLTVMARVAATDERLAPLRARIDRTADRTRAALYAPSVRAMAVRMLDGMLTAAAAVDGRATLDAFDAVITLAGGCLDVTSSIIRRGVDTLDDPEVRRLIGVVVQTLAEQHNITARQTANIAILYDRAPNKRWNIAVELGGDGWGVMYDQRGPSPVAMIYAPFNDLGAREVAALLADVHHGVTNPFLGRR